MSTEKPKTLASHAVAEGDVSGSSGDSHLGPDDTRTSSATAPVILTDSNENVDNDFTKEVIVTGRGGGGFESTTSRILIHSYCI